MDINIVGDNDINMLDSLDDFDNLDSDEINSSEELIISTNEVQERGTI